MVRIAFGVSQQVDRRPGRIGRALGDDVRHLLQTAAVDGQEALDIINLVRARARALIATAQNPAVSDKAGIAEYILKERSREFAFEGKRWFDLLRNAKRNNYQR